MADPPRYPDSGDDTGVGSGESTASTPGVDDTALDPEPTTTGSRASKLVIAGVAALVVVIVILHLTGVVGPGAH